MILNNALLLLLLVLAIAAGWTLARGGLRIGGADQAQLPSQYYRGFNFLLDGEEEGAVDAFTEALAVNEETLDTHIALGSVLRKRGEVDRAIRIHQSLLARPQLTEVQLHQSHLELARDFIAAGLYDRAETLLLDLVAQSSDLRQTAQRHLLEVHEAQRDWQSAVAIAEALIAVSKVDDSAMGSQGQAAHQLRSHYLCEQAEAALERGNSKAARPFFEDALRDNAEELRALMGLVRLALSEDDTDQALQHFELIINSGRASAPDVLSLLEEICSRQSNPELQLSCLERYYEKQPCSLLARALAQQLQAHEGKEKAHAFLRSTLADKPSASIAASLLLGETVGQQTCLERDILEQFANADAGYRCDHCGFAGKSRHWRCPGCRHWDSIHYLGAVLEHPHA
jgi:lipopolysaccharide biosynthesis regulator YciM